MRLRELGWGLRGVLNGVGLLTDDRGMRDTLSLATLRPRAPDAHKGTCGQVLVVAGSRSYPGAAVLTALGAVRAGAGYVHLAVPEAIVGWVLPAVPFCVLHATPGEAHGEGRQTLLEAAAKVDAVVLGPGLGRADATRALASGLLDEIAAPLVLDADGLLAWGGRAPPHAGPRVLTPHPGEFARLDGGSVPRDPNERVERAEAFARASGAVVVLKGAGTVVTDGARTRVDTRAGPELAAAGTGDVLAGLIGALLARDEIEDVAAAAALGVDLHARAGRLAAEERGVEAVVPTDVADRLGAAMARAGVP